MKNTDILKHQVRLDNLLARLRRLNMTIHSFSNLPTTSRELLSRQIADMKTLVSEMRDALQAQMEPIDIEKFARIHDGLVALQNIQKMRDAGFQSCQSFQGLQTENTHEHGYSAEKSVSADVA